MYWNRTPVGAENVLGYLLLLLYCCRRYVAANGRRNDRTTGLISTEIGRKDFGLLAGWVQRINVGLGAGATPNTQIGSPARSPKEVSRASILRIEIVRVLVSGVFLECFDKFKP